MFRVPGALVIAQTASAKLSITRLPPVQAATFS
jgi:hypothetical protein